MPNNPDFMANLTNRNGRPRGSKNKLRFSDVITDDKLLAVIEELYDIAINSKSDRNRIAAMQMIIERRLGKVPAEIHQTIETSSTLADILSPQDTTEE